MQKSRGDALCVLHGTENGSLSPLKYSVKFFIPEFNKLEFKTCKGILVQIALCFVKACRSWPCVILL